MSALNTQESRIKNLRRQGRSILNNSTNSAFTDRGIDSVKGRASSGGEHIGVIQRDTEEMEPATGAGSGDLSLDNVIADRVTH